MARHATGASACKKRPTADPTLVLLDLNMPAMTGWEVLPWLRRKLPEAMIVILSTLSAPGLEQRAPVDGRRRLYHQANGRL